MPRVSTSTSKRPRAEEAEAEALARLTTVPLKIAGVLFGLTNGGAKGVAREQLLAPLEHIGCLNPNNATQKNRIENYPTADWFLHEGKGAEARIGLSREGVDAIHALFTNDEDEVDQDGLDALTRATTATTAAAPAAAPEAVATPISQRKPARQATATAGGGGGGAPAPAPAAVVEVEARFDDDEVLETEEDEDEDDEDDENPSIKELQKRLDLLSQRFDERIQKTSLAAAYGELAAEFFNTNGRVATAPEGDRLLREARDEMYAGIELGDGKVLHSELRDIFLRLENAAGLAAEVRALEERASTAK